MNDDPIVVEFRAAIRQFEAVQSQYRAYGAIDTEPRKIFYDLLRKAARGVPAPVLNGTAKASKAAATPGFP